MSDSLTSNQWVSLSAREPPEDCPRLLVTNNVTARDAFGHHSHIWLTSMVHKQKDGSYSAFDEHDMKLHGITHWRYAVPEDSGVETTSRHTLDCSLVKHPNCTNCDCGADDDEGTADLCMRFELAGELVRAMFPYVEQFECADAAELEAKGLLLKRAEWLRPAVKTSTEGAP